MAIPSSYTEKTLAEYMHVSLGKTAKALDLHFDPNGPGDYVEAVNDTLLDYGTDDITTITGLDAIKKLRMLAVASAWQFVVNNFVALYDFSADGGRYNRNQLFTNAQKMLETAAGVVAANYGTGSNTIRIRKVDHIHDPYTVRDRTERPL